MRVAKTRPSASASRLRPRIRLTASLARPPTAEFREPRGFGRIDIEPDDPEACRDQPARQHLAHQADADHTDGILPLHTEDLVCRLPCYLDSCHPDWRKLTTAKREDVA